MQVPVPLRRSARGLAIAAVAGLLAAGCAGHGAATLDRASNPAAGLGGAGGAGGAGGQVTTPGGGGSTGVPPTGTTPSNRPPTDSPPPAGGGGASGFTQDDLKTYAYAFSDEATLAAALGTTSGEIVALEADLQARNVQAAEADAGRLLTDAKAIDADAGDATARMQPLGPADGDLRRIRTDALEAFGLTEDYAGTTVALAEAAMNLDMQEIAKILQQAASLQGTASQLTASYQSLSSELAAFAEADPQAAALAMATYGS